MDLTTWLQEEKEITDSGLKDFFTHKFQQSELIDASLAEVVEMIGQQVLRGGKKARPLLVRLSYELATGKKADNEVKFVSLFVELVHNFLLVHDDIADRDLLRYGGPTLEVRFNEEFEKEFKKPNLHVGKTMAMLAGDHVLTLAHDLLTDSKIPAEKIVTIEKLTSEILTDTFAGWQLQFKQNYLSIGEAKREEFLKGMELVSAKYSFEYPLRIGVILANREDLTPKIKDFAYHVGMAFQIQDDILGLFGKSEDTGKPVGNDVREGKKTLLMLDAWEQADSRDQKFIEKVLGHEFKAKDLIRIQKIVENTGALDKSKARACDHVDQAKLDLQQMAKVDSKAMEKLSGLADFVWQRNH
jgi:geranylgeranyl diphosphate synthase type I